MMSSNKRQRIQRHTKTHSVYSDEDRLAVVDGFSTEESKQRSLELVLSKL